MPRRIPYHGATPHAPAAARLYERMAGRRDDKAFYKSPAWRRIRAVVLVEQPLCVACQEAGRVTMAEHVDHILDRKDRPDLALDRENLQGLCPPCHNAKRALHRD